MKHQAFLALALLAVPNLCWACGTGAVQFEDNFKTPDSGWAIGSLAKAAGGVLTLAPPVNRSAYTSNSTYIFEKADVCAQIKNPDFLTSGGSTAGIMFWAEGGNFYDFLIYTDGKYSISRAVGPRFLYIKNGSSPAIKTGKGDVNEVEVRVDGKTASTYVNGTKIEDISGQEPSGGGLFGLYAESEKDHADLWEFSDFKILSLP